MFATVGVGVALYVELFVIGQTVEIHMKEHLRLRELEGVYREYLCARAGEFIWSDACAWWWGSYAELFVIAWTVEIHTKEHLRLCELEGVV